MKIESYHIIVGNATDIGQIREHNEDYLAHFEMPGGYCVIVCDGMGGHAAGEIASQGATEAIKHYLQDGKLTKLDTAVSLHNAIEFANYKLREMVQQNAGLAGMGTTCVMMVIINDEMYVAHAGDSRLYLIRDNCIKQLTKDHSTIQNLIDAGVLTGEEARVSDKRNQITKAIGIFEKVNPTVAKYPFRLKHKDKFLLCTDGLTAHVEDEDLLKIVSSHADVQVAAMKLIEMANNGGGTDNITVQVIQYTGQSSATRKHQRLKKLVFIVSFILIASALSFYAFKKWGTSSKDIPMTDKTIESSA